MTVHSLEGVLRCADLGFTRVVLARELTKPAIEYICAPLPHRDRGVRPRALCMCYSGQCYLSSLSAGAAATGAVRPALRMAYGWGELAGRLSPYLSLKDLSLAGHLRELDDMGVTCVKIEGRMKRPNSGRGHLVLFRRHPGGGASPPPRSCAD
jgi:putative protease